MFDQVKISTPPHSPQKVLKRPKLGKISYRFSFSEVFSPEKGMSSFGGKHHNSFGVCFAKVLSFSFQKKSTSTLHSMNHKLKKSKWNVEVTKNGFLKSILSGVWRSFRLQNHKSGLWRFLNIF